MGLRFQLFGISDLEMVDQTGVVPAREAEAARRATTSGWPRTLSEGYGPDRRQLEPRRHVVAPAPTAEATSVDRQTTRLERPIYS